MNSSMGLFEDYPTSGAAIRAAADATRGRITAVRDLATSVMEDHRGAVDAVEGSLLSSMQQAPTEALTRATDVNREAELAAGCLEYFGLGVDDYNRLRATRPRAVSLLNTDWREALAGNFGVRYSDYVSEPTAPDYEQSLDEYYAVCQSRREALRSSLTSENANALELLDERAAEVVAILEAGPGNHTNIRTLWAAGALPFYAPLIFTDTDLTLTPTTAAVARALEAYLDAHPSERDNPYLQVLQSTVVGPEPSQEEIDEALANLRDAGLLGEDEEPDGYYLSWLTWTLRKGLTPDDVVGRAREEDVSMESFDPLRKDAGDGFIGPDGRMYYLLTDDVGAAAIARANELMHGGTPSVTTLRRSNNEWTYDGWLALESDVEVILNSGGAIAVTPEGTLMAAPGPDTAGIPNVVDVFASRGGTTYMETYIINGSFSDPEAALQERIETGTKDGEDHHGEFPGDLRTYTTEDGGVGYDGSDSLNHRLMHERLHSAQWGRWGAGFSVRYLADSDTYEDEAVYAWGGYGEDAVDGYSEDVQDMTHDWPTESTAIEAEETGPPPGTTTTTTTTIAADTPPEPPSEPGTGGPDSGTTTSTTTTTTTAPATTSG